MSRDDRHEVLEPEVLPPEGSGGGRTYRRPRAGGGLTVPGKWRRVAGSLACGLVLDAAARVMFFWPGALVGAMLGWYIARVERALPGQQLWWIAISALYVAAPRVHFFPVAALFLVSRALWRR